MSYMNRVIVVNPVHKQAARRIGFDSTQTFENALERAMQIVGRSPQITYFHCPPIAMCDLV
jgi:hypothetical protein